MRQLRQAGGKTAYLTRIVRQVSGRAAVAPALPGTSEEGTGWPGFGWRAYGRTREAESAVRVDGAGGVAAQGRLYQPPRQACSLSGCETSLAPTMMRPTSDMILPSVF